MALTLGQAPDHGFDQPLGLLSDCHRRIEHFLGAMAAVTQAVRGGPLADPDRRVLHVAREYFALAGPRHTADEEGSLFPRLVRASGDEAARLRDTLQALEADHRRAEGLHADVDALLAKWIAAGTLPPSDGQTLHDKIEELSALYSRHIAIEDGTLFPAAARVLSPASLEEVGREMAARRNVPYGPPPGLAALRRR